MIQQRNETKSTFASSSVNNSRVSNIKESKKTKMKNKQSWDVMKSSSTREFYNRLNEGQLINYSSKVFYFVNYFEKQKTRPKFYYNVLVIMFFSQLIGSVSVSQSNFGNNLVNIIFKACEYTRLTSLMKDYFSIDPNIQGLVLQFLILSFELLFLVVFFILGNSTTNLSDKKFKERYALMGYATIFLELQKWFYYNIKADLTASLIFCRENSSLQKCSSSLSYQDDMLTYSLIVINIVISLCICQINSVIHSISQFTPINILRSSYSNRKILEFIIILVVHSISYLGDLISLILFEILALYYYYEYFVYYPIYTKQITLFYAICLNFFFAATLLFHIRYYTHISDPLFLFMLLITGSFLGGVQAQWEKIKLVKTRTFNFNHYSSHPNQTVSTLQEIVYLTIQKSYENQLILLGMFEVHQRECEDQFCPCKFQMVLNEDQNENKKVDQGSIIPISGVPNKGLEQFKATRKNVYRDKEDLEDFNILQMHKRFSHHDTKSIRSSKTFSSASKHNTIQSYKTKMFSDAVNKQNEELQIRKQSESQLSSIRPSSPVRANRYQKKRSRTVKGQFKLQVVKFQILSQDYPSFKKWILTFVDYHFEQLLRHLYISRQYYALITLGIRYIYFEIEIKANYIKALYFVKKWVQNIPQKSAYFQVVEQQISDLIENNIKDRDKALKYSIRKKDNIEAKTYENFESYVVLEEIYKCFHHKLLDLIKLKQLYYSNMIEGYESMNELFKISHNLIQKCGIYVYQANKYYNQYQSSPQLTKQLDIRKAIIIDQQLYESINKLDYYTQAHTISGQEIIQGNIASIIAQFRTKVGKIVKYSSNAPEFFGYRKYEFDTLQSLNDLIPSAISERHDMFLERLIEEGSSKILRKYRQTFAKNSQGHIFPVKIYINYFFELQNDFIFSALLSKVKSNSQFILITSSGFIDGYSKSFFEFCKAICPSLNDQSLQYSNIHLYFEDLEKYLREANQLTNTNNRKLILNLNTEMHTLANRFKALWKRDRSQGRLMNVIMNVQEEFEDEEDNQFSFDVTMNINLMQNNLINGEQLSLYLMEITSVIPKKDILKSIMITKTNQLISSRFLDFDLPNQNNNNHSFCNGESQNFNNKNTIDFFGKNNKQTSTSPKAFIFKFNEESLQREQKKKSSIVQHYQGSTRSIKLLEEVISEQLEENEEDIHQQAEYQLKSTARMITSPLNKSNFIDQISIKDIKDEGQIPFSNNKLISLKDIDNHISPRSVSESNFHIHNSLIQFNHNYGDGNDNEEEYGNNYTDRIRKCQNPQIHSTQVLQKIIAEEDEVNESQLIEDKNTLRKQSSSYDQTEYNSIRNSTFTKLNLIINSNKEQQSPTYEEVKANNLRKQSYSPIDNNQCKYFIDNNNYKQTIHNDQPINKQESYSDLQQIKQSTNSQGQSKHTTQIIQTSNSRNSKRPSKIDIINRISELTEKNNAVNLDCSLSSSSSTELSVFMNYQLNKHLDDQGSTQSVGSFQNQETTAKQNTSEISDTAKKIKRLFQINNQLNYPSFIALIQLSSLLLLSTLIFGLIVNSSTHSSYLNDLTSIISKYDIQQNTLLAISQSVSAIFALEQNTNEEQTKQFYQNTIKDSLDRINSIINRVTQNHIVEFDDVDKKNVDTGITLRFQLFQIQSSLYLTLQQAVNPYLKRSVNSTFKIKQLMEQFSENVQKNVEDYFDLYQNKDIMVLIIELSLLTLSLFLFLRVYFKYTYYIQQYLYITTRITLKEAEIELSRLSNILSFLDQNQNSYLRFNIDSENINSLSVMKGTKINSGDKNKNIQMLFNRIKVQKLYFYRFITLINVVFLLSIIHQTSSVQLIVGYFKIKVFAVFNNQISSIEFPLRLYEEYSQKISDLSVLNLSHQFYQLQKLNIEQSKDYFNNNINQLKEYYLEQFQTIPIKGQSYYYSSKIQFLNEENACQIFDNNQFQEQFCLSIQSSILQQGLIQGFRKMFNFYQDTPSIDDQQNKQQILESLNLNIIILQILDKSKTYIFESPGQIESVQRPSKKLLIYFGYILLIFTSFALGIYFYKKMKSDLRLIQQCIQFIPLKRLLQDNSTVQLIKNLNK